MPSSIICPVPLDVPPALKAWNPAPRTWSRLHPTTTTSSARWRSSFGPILTSGKLVFFRVYSGQLKKGDTIYNPRTRKRERVSRLMVIQADERKDVDNVYAGDIAALVGLRNITTGDTLCDEDFDVTLEPPTFPEPVIRMAVEPKTKAGPRQNVRRSATPGGRRSDFPLLYQRRNQPAHYRGHG